MASRPRRSMFSAATVGGAADQRRGDEDAQEQRTEVPVFGVTEATNCLGPVELRKHRSSMSRWPRPPGSRLPLPVIRDASCGSSAGRARRRDASGIFTHLERGPLASNVGLPRAHRQLRTMSGGGRRLGGRGHPSGG